MKTVSLKTLVREEYERLVSDIESKHTEIENKLEELRKLYSEEMCIREFMGTTFDAPLERRLEVATVAELIEVPINELVMYFLNCVKTENTRKLVEYHLGHVYFYAN